MQQKTIPIILHPNFTRITAIFFGYCIWFFASNCVWVTKEISIPICFYQTKNRIIQAPEYATIKITGPRNQMHHLNMSDLAINLDIADLQDGNHEIILNSSNLFLPETLKLVELIPAVIVCNILTP